MKWSDHNTNTKTSWTNIATDNNSNNNHLNVNRREGKGMPLTSSHDEVGIKKWIELLLMVKGVWNKDDGLMEKKVGVGGI